MKQTIQGVIFDWAGTTVDFGCFAPVSAFVEAFRKAGIDVTLEETRAHAAFPKVPRSYPSRQNRVRLN